jgi:hypothetical protein
LISIDLISEGAGMNFLWLYQIPTLWLGILIVGLFAGASIASLA